MSELSAEDRAGARHAIAGVVADIALHRCHPTETLVDSIVDAVARRLPAPLLPPKPDRYELQPAERAAAEDVLVRHLPPEAFEFGWPVLDEILAAINEVRGFQNV